MDVKLLFIVWELGVKMQASNQKKNTLLYEGHTVVRLCAENTGEIKETNTNDCETANEKGEQPTATPLFLSASLVRAIP